MEDKIEPISLNEILKIDGLENVKIRFNLMIEGNWNPTDIFRDGDSEKLLAVSIGITKRINPSKKVKSQLAF